MNSYSSSCLSHWHSKHTQREEASLILAQSVRAIVVETLKRAFYTIQGLSSTRLYLAGIRPVKQLFHNHSRKSF